MTNKKLIAASLFSNVGIAETYFKDIGIKVAIANELVKERAKFYKHLYPETNMILGDITNERIFNKLVSESKKARVNFVIATPPCQGMSCAGKKDEKDPRNFLIYYAIQFIKKVKPDFVLLENVPMQQHTKIKYKGKQFLIPDYIKHELGELYKFNNSRIVNSKDYGVPQSRSRYIYLMTKKELGIIWEFPEKEKHIITLKEAIGNLPTLDPIVREESYRFKFPDCEKKRKAALKISKWHYPPTHGWRQIEWMMHTPSGKSAFQNNIFYPSKNGRKIKGAPRTYMRMDWNKPATTVLTNNGVISAFSTVHPGRINKDGTYSDPRVLSIYELLIITSLPKDWNIPSWASDTLIRKVIGEGIPPLLIKKIVQSLLGKI